MKYQYKGKNIICFDIDELAVIFRVSKEKLIAEEITKSGYSTEELLANNKEKMWELAGNASKKIKNKEDIEIFSVLYVFQRFYPASKICFQLKDSANIHNIQTLEDLKESLKEGDLMDFGLRSEDGFRAFQLKAYTGVISPDDLFNYLDKKLKHYGYALGDTNLLVPLRGSGVITPSLFKIIHERLKTLPIQGGGNILISFNDRNQFDVIQTVRPILGITKIPHKSYFSSNSQS